MKQIFGVLADDASGTLWACSNDIGDGPPGASPPKPSFLHAFDLASGAAKASYGFPDGGMCNGIAVVSGRVIVNTLATSKLFAAEVAADGKAGAVTELTLSAPVNGPEGVVSVATVGSMGYALEGQLGLLFAPGSAVEKPYRAVGFALP